ncbi:hypothetical protein SIM54_22690 [Bacillus cereus group sp. BfR-BA-02147]|uniref:hypothetical protein n=1 Tax=Bacillus cereus group sp. BfR-BA-02147 TaxID=3094887 RepID=UPI0029C2559E|nr:hypothetical protein [Bacillus cereus group sp. BfR-BA-02147]MDX5828888.1 hypothetical protein [Bacillus cereus group sp. BfR-BA-02147]
MDTQIKKKDKAKSIKGLIKIISMITLVTGFVVYTGLCLNDYLNKEYAIKIEQTRANVRIAEEMVEKELNTNSKYFQMINRTNNESDLSYGDYLDSNTDSYWIDEKLKSEVQLEGDSYIVTFETKRVDPKNEELEMYEPVKINKIIKEKS